MVIGIVVIEIKLFQVFHVIEGSCNFVDFVSLFIKVRCSLAKVGGHRHCCSEDIMVLVCHVISRE